MATLFSLAIVSSIVLIALYLAYKLLLAPLKQPVINRVTIILIYIISIAAWPVSQWIAQSSKTAATSANAVHGISIDALTAEFITSPETANRLADALLLIYYIGVALVALITIIGVTKLIVSLRRSPLIEIEGSRVRLMDNTDAAPFSFFGMMAMGRHDLCDARLIVSHERCHQRRRHSIDLLLAQLVAIFQWFNPAAWLMMRELKAVHEFDVDEQLISAGINLKEYQYLLIKKAVGARFPSLANSLNHSNLKNRITMMQKSNDAKSRRWRALALAPALILALSVTHLSSVASVIEAAASSRMPGVSNGKVTENNPAEQAIAA
ncbi:MAG: hypothetical protein K2H61_01060, partial [Muribaculaceae bacterium]|nr:hypothetical protein [Muribaculaceae bacterium]